MDFKIQFLSDGVNDHQDLWEIYHPSVKPFDQFGFSFIRLIRGDFLVLKNHFKMTRLSLWNDGHAKIYCLLFEPLGQWSGPTSLGAFAVAPDLTPEEARFFWHQILSVFPKLSPIAPLNGHAYLGLSIPESSSDFNRIGFMTSGYSSSLESLLAAHPHRTLYRTLHSYETKVTPERVQQWTLSETTRPAHISLRQISLWNRKDDLNTLNQLVNRCFTDHFDFCPLTDEENFDIMEFSPAFLQKGLGLFLLYDQQPIGFCFGFKDYHQIMKPNQDLRNLSRMFTSKKIRRGRLVHIGILPEFRGQKLIKYLRHPILLNLYRQGCETIENSYIDEGNINSQKNVQSTGAQSLNRFCLYRLNSADFIAEI